MLWWQGCFKANQIIKYFEENPKTNPLQMTLSVLFNFFSNLMLAYYAPDKSEQGIANQLGLKSPWQSKDYMAAMRKYSGVKVMQIIGEIRYCDAKSKEWVIHLWRMEICCENLYTKFFIN